jgi:hypothetical protein
VVKELECDTDTDGDDLMVQEATETLKMLTAHQEHTVDFYRQLSSSLNVLSIQCNNLVLKNVSFLFVLS